MMQYGVHIMYGFRQLLESKTTTIAACCFTDSFITPVRVESAGEIISSRLRSELHLSYSVD